MSQPNTLDVAEVLPSAGALIGIVLVGALLFGAAFLVTTWLTRKQAVWRGRGAALDRVVTWLPVVQIAAWALAMSAFLAVIAVAPPQTAIWILVPGVIALVIASRDLVRNAIAGVLLALEHAVIAGDNIHIETTQGDVHGMIISIGLRRTALACADGTEVHIPNHTMLTTTVRTNRRHEQDSVVEVQLPLSGVDVKDLESLKTLAKRAAGISRFSSPRKAPEVFLQTSVNGSYALHIQAYAFSPAYVRHLQSDITELVREALETTLTPKALAHEAPKVTLTPKAHDDDTIL